MLSNKWLNRARWFRPWRQRSANLGGTSYCNGVNNRFGRQEVLEYTQVYRGTDNSRSPRAPKKYRIKLLCVYRLKNILYGRCRCCLCHMGSRRFAVRLETLISRHRRLTPSVPLLLYYYYYYYYYYYCCSYYYYTTTTTTNTITTTVIMRRLAPGCDRF